jgi:hypothetical protein
MTLRASATQERPLMVNTDDLKARELSVGRECEY